MTDPNRLQVVPVPAFKDNYIWVLHDGRSAAVVDPGDAQPVLEYLARERLELVLAEGDRIAIPALGAQFEVFDVPGHTRAHIAYYGSKRLFCGDTLFACGCGRVFDGTPPQLHASLAKLAERERADIRTREQQRPTVPSTIGREKATNPFLRFAEPEVAQSASRYHGAALAGPVEVFAAIRQWKNEL